MTAKKKHVPQRTCVACRQVKNKRDLIRVVKTPDDIIVIDETGKLQGRGAYLCRQHSCWQNGLKQGSIGRALKISIDAETVKFLETYAAGFA